MEMERSEKMNKFFPKYILTALILAFLIFFVIPVNTYSLEAQVEKNILIIHQFGEGYPSHKLFNEGLINEMEKDSRYKFNYSYEYLNMDKYSDNEDYLRATAEYLKLKHINSNVKPDIIFASDGVADFLSKYGNRLFIDAPIITVWAGEGNAPSDVLAKNFVIPALPNYNENISLIQNIQSDVKKIYVVIGDSKSERYALEKIKRAAENYSDKIQFTYLNKLSYLEMLDTLSETDNNSAILFVRWVIDAYGQSFVPVNVLKNITKEAKAPVYGMHIQYLGTGIVGGYLYDQGLIAKNAGRIGIRLLDGDNVESILLTDSKFHKYAFDGRVLDRWAIDSSKLPEKSIIEYREKDLWTLYGKYVIFGGIIILFETALIVGLINSRRKRRKAEEDLLLLNYSLEKLVDGRTQELQEAKGKLEDLNKQLTCLSMIDELTGLYNRRHMEERLNEEYQKFKREDQIFSIMIADIDDFKKINDKYGHDAGDMVLKALSNTIRGMTREYDVVARWGGEEFLMLFPNLVNGNGELRAEEIRKAVEKEIHSYGSENFSVTLTIGVSTISKNETIEEVIKRADNALYQGKKTGKNKVVVSV